MTMGRAIRRYSPASTRFWGGAAIASYVLLWVLFIGLSVLVSAMTASGTSTPQNSTPVMVVGLGILIVMVAFIFPVVAFSIVLYRGWIQIRSLEGTIPAGLAVGLNFVPLFNIVWIFFSYCGLARKMNAYMRLHGIPGPGAPFGVCLAGCILMFTGLIPLIGVLTGLTGLVLFGVGFWGITKTAAAIGDSEEDPDPYYYDDADLAPVPVGVFDEPERV